MHISDPLISLNPRRNAESLIGVPPLFVSGCRRINGLRQFTVALWIRPYDGETGNVTLLTKGVLGDASGEMFTISLQRNGSGTIVGAHVRIRICTILFRAWGTHSNFTSVFVSVFVNYSNTEGDAAFRDARAIERWECQQILHGERNL